MGKKFRRRNIAANVTETFPLTPQEKPELETLRTIERTIVVPTDPPVRQCGIGGCTTWYDDPVVMERHRRRCHGIGVVNRNRPKPIERGRNLRG